MTSYSILLCCLPMSLNRERPDQTDKQNTTANRTKSTHRRDTTLARPSETDKRSDSSFGIAGPFAASVPIPNVVMILSTMQRKDDGPTDAKNASTLRVLSVVIDTKARNQSTIVSRLGYVINVKRRSALML